MQAMDEGMAAHAVEQFYYLARTTLVKDEQQSRPLRSRVRSCLQGARGWPERIARRDPRRMAAQAHREVPHRRRKEADRSARRLGQDHGGAEEAPRRAEGPSSGRHRNGSAPLAPRPSAPTATIPKACASARTRTATIAPIKVWDRRDYRGSRRHASSSAPATSSSRCAACANSRAKVRPEELDLDGTIRSTANHGYLDLQLRPRAPQYA